MSKDPLRYFRIEARELVDQLSQGALDLDGTADRELIARLLRYAHTLKGAARVVRQTEIAEHANSLEELLVPHRQAAAPLPPADIALLLRLVDDLSALVARLNQPSPEGTAVTAATAAEPAPTDAAQPGRADVDDIDELLDAIGEAHARFAPLARAAAAAERARRAGDLLGEQLRTRAVRSGAADDPARLTLARLNADLGALVRQLTETTEQVQRELDEVRGRAEQLRLVSAASIFTSLHRAVRDAADIEGKRVRFEGRGGDLRLDPQVLAQVGNALLHLVRNAVSHGVESTSQRQEAGKPVEGRVTVDVSRRGRTAAFRCRDDGRGFDLSAVRKVAEANGLIPPGTTEPDPGVLVALLMRGGLTTSATVTDVSGRGIGLDAVRDVAERLGGDVSVSTEPGSGTTVELVVPMTLVSVSGLLVEAAGVPATLPLDAVRTCVRLSREDAARATAVGAVPHAGHVIPFQPLARSLLRQPGYAPPGGVVAVVVNADDGAAAVGVDRLLGTTTLVVRPLPELALADPVVGGLSVDVDGNPSVVLDPHVLVDDVVRRSADVTGASGYEEPDGPATAPVLVVDDSLTTRMLERSILESAGYEVDLAASGEEALEKVRNGRYALFLVDIDMPGIDGFTFVERTRADPRLRDVPAILVSSRSSPEDRRRGADAGASAFMVKSEFDQQKLLGHIRQLVRR